MPCRKKRMFHLKITEGDQSPIGMGMFTPVAAAIPKFGDPSAFQVSFCILGALAPFVVAGMLRAWYTNQFSVCNTPFPSV